MADHLESGEGGKCVVQTDEVQSGFTPGQTYNITVKAARDALFKLHSSDGQCLGQSVGFDEASTSKTFLWTAPAEDVTFYALCGASYAQIYSAEPSNAIQMRAALSQGQMHSLRRGSDFNDIGSSVSEYVRQHSMGASCLELMDSIEEEQFKRFQRNPDEPLDVQGVSDQIARRSMTLLAREMPALVGKVRRSMEQRSNDAGPAITAEDMCMTILKHYDEL